MTRTPAPTIALNDGTALPRIGFGTYQLNGSSGVRAVQDAIANGYRLIDSAFSYENEGAVGEAVRRSRIPRAELLITSKLRGRHHGFDEAIATVEESVYRFGLEYIDLYLIHWPNPGRDRYVEAWAGLVEARRRGLVRSIGVSNFLPEHIDRLVRETGVTPAVNQIEMHPYFPQDEQRIHDAGRGIVTEAWSPMGRGPELLEEPVITAVAERVGRTAAQVILRWQTQLGAVPLPKSANPSRQRENLAVFDFELSSRDLADIATLARPDGRIWHQDPATYEEF